MNGFHPRLVALALLLASACAERDHPRVIKLAHGLPTSHPVHEAMVFFADETARASSGSLLVDVHPAEQLGTERECLELLQIGAIGMTKVSASVLENFVPVYAVLSLPYIFRDEAHRQRVYRSEVGRRLLESGEGQGIRGLTYYDAGSRSFYAKDRAIETPADLAGLKIRTQESALALQMVQAMGAAATPIAWGELYTALEQGVVDGAENNPPSFYLSGHYEVARHYTLDEHTSTPDVLLVSASLWSSLSRNEQEILRAAAEKSAELQLELWRRATAEALEAVREAGVKVLVPDKRAFAEAVAPLYARFLERPELAAFVEAIRSVP